jgi:hypothetical protein
MPIKEDIQATIDKNDVVLFMKGTPDIPQCGFSGQVVQIMNYLGVSYAPVNCLASDEIRLRHCPGNVSVGRTRGASDGQGRPLQAAGQGLSGTGSPWDCLDGTILLAAVCWPVN